MRFCKWFAILSFTAIMTTATANAQDQRAKCTVFPAEVRWTIQKLKLVRGKKMLFVAGSNKQYTSYQCKRYEVVDKEDSLKRRIIDEADCVKYHFWCSGYELTGKWFESRTFIEGLRAIVNEVEKQTPLGIRANIVSVALLEKDNRVQNNEYGLTESDCGKDCRLDGEFLNAITARLGIISSHTLTVEDPTDLDRFNPAPDCAYAKIVLVEKESGKRSPVILRSDNDPTVEFVE